MTDSEILDWLETHPHFHFEPTGGLIVIWDGPFGDDHRDKLAAGRTLREAVKNAAAKLRDLVRD